MSYRDSLFLRARAFVDLGVLRPGFIGGCGSSLPSHGSCRPGHLAAFHPGPCSRLLIGGPPDDPSRGEFAEPGGEEAPLRLSLGEFDRALVRIPGFRVAAHAAEQVGPGGVVVAVVPEIEPVEDGQARVGSRLDVGRMY